jgi:hypothetical protein
MSATTKCTKGRKPTKAEGWEAYLDWCKIECNCPKHQDQEG